MKPQQPDPRQQTCQRCGWTCDDAGTFATDVLCHVCITAPPRPTNFGLVLADAAQHARMAGEDIDDAFEAMDANVEIAVGLDLVCAQAHVRTAQRLIAHAADAQAVKR